MENGDRLDGRMLAFLLGAAAFFVAAVCPWRVTLPLADDASYFYGSLFAARGVSRIPAAEFAALESLPRPETPTPAAPGPPLQVVPAGAGFYASEKPPGYVWWLALLRIFHLDARAHVIAFVLFFPAATLLLRGAVGARAACWAGFFFLATPLSLAFAYRPYMPTFFGALLIYLALALFINVAAGGDAAFAKMAACGAAAAVLGVTRYTDWPLVVALGVAAALLPGRGRRWVLPAAFLVPVIAGVAVVSFYNGHVFGAPWRTGYSRRLTAGVNPNAVTSLWERRPLTLAPSSCVRRGKRVSLAECPQPEILTAGGEARRAWRTVDELAISFTPAWQGRVHFSAEWAAVNPAGSPGAGAAALRVTSAGRTLFADTAAPPSDWRAATFDYEAVPGEGLTFVISAPAGRGCEVYLTAPRAETPAGGYELTNWIPRAVPLAAVVVRNVIGIYPYLLIAIPVILLMPFGVAAARRELPAGSFWLTAAVALWVVAYYLQVRLYSAGYFLAVGRYYSPALAPFALWAAFAAKAAPAPARWVLAAVIAAVAIGTYIMALVVMGGLDAPWLVPRLGAAFFG